MTTNTTSGRILDLYAAHCRTRLRHSENTVILRMGYLQRFDRQTPLTTATAEDLWAWLDQHPTWSESTSGVFVSAVQSFYPWALEHGHVSVNPALDMPLPKIRKRRSRIATDDTLLSALGETSTIERAMLLLGAECGLRVSEIASLRASDRDGEWLYVLGKGGTTRLVHLTIELIQALDAIERETMRWGYYFPSPRHTGRHLTANAVYCRVRKLTGYNTHALRHRAGTAVYRRAGNDLRLAQEFLGHSSPTTTAIYVHIDRDDMRRASTAARLHVATDDCDRRRTIEAILS